jgi:hypothetical protein
VQRDLPQMRGPGSTRQPNQQLIAIERDLLCVLCQSGGLAELSLQTRSELRSYSWQGSDHQTIFDALLHIVRVARGSLREQLAAQATRMGFPDVNWNEYFGQAGAAADELQQSVMDLMRELKAEAERER